MTGALLALALAAPPAPPAVDLETLHRALASAPAWRVEFVQNYVPAGLDAGTRDTGTLLLAPPARLRFDYSGTNPRVFAVDGAVARLVEAAAGSCEAVALDQGKWGRLPLTALLDPQAARHAFLVEAGVDQLRLVPTDAALDVAEIVVVVGPQSLPISVRISDSLGNRNEFQLSGWTAVADPGIEPFRPHLPGSPACGPDER
jgi:outer membrane lipoprotein-sorting protein